MHPPLAQRQVVGFYNRKGNNMSNYKSLYEDTDSATQGAYTKQVLNSIYGMQSVKHMNREYISVIVDDKPTVIFKRNIIAVTKNVAHSEIICVNDVTFYTKEDYASVVKKIIG